jgi:hypothetical protein
LFAATVACFCLYGVVAYLFLNFVWGGVGWGYIVFVRGVAMLLDVHLCVCCSLLGCLF